MRDETKRFSPHARVRVIEKRRERPEVRAGREKIVQRGEYASPTAFYAPRDFRVRGREFRG